MTLRKRVGRGERPGGVVDRDHIDLAGVDVLTERSQGLVLRVVPLGATVDEPDVVRAEMRCERRGDLGTVLRADDHDDPVDALDLEGRAHAVREHRRPVEPRAGPCCARRRPVDRSRRRARRPPHGARESAYRSQVRPDHPDQSARDQLVALERKHVPGIRYDGQHRAVDVVGDPARVRRRREHVAGAHDHVGRDAVEDLERVRRGRGACSPRRSRPSWPARS